MPITHTYAAVEPLRADIDELTEPVVLEFGAPWCGYCIRAQPLLEAAFAPHPELQHIKIEDGPGRPLGRSFRVKLWPTLVVLREGVELARVVRPRPAWTRSAKPWPGLAIAPHSGREPVAVPCVIAADYHPLNLPSENPMTISLHQASIPVFLRALANLRHVLQKGEAFAAEKGVEPEVLLQQRLIVDMLPLVRNVQIACDLAKNGACRLADVEPPKFEDTETTFAQLYERIERVLELIRAVTPGQVDGNEARQVTMQTRAGELTMDAQSYLLHFSIPNLFFHCTTSYAILREAGVPIGKMDFMGAPR